MSYKVLLIQLACGTDERTGESEFLTLAKEVEIPFPLTGPMLLGLDHDSRFNSNSLIIRRVMWHQHEQRFHAELEPDRFVGPLSETIDQYVKSGWSLFLPEYSWDESEIRDRDFDDTNTEYAVRIEGKCYLVDFNEMAYLRSEGRELTVVRSRS